MLTACAVVVSAGLLEFIPVMTSPSTIVFFLALIVAFFFAILRMSCQRFVRFRWGDVLALGVVAVTLLSVIPATLNGVSFGNWFRGAIPFLFYSFFVILNGLDDTRSRKVLTNATLICCFVWLVRIIYQTATSIPAVLSGDLGRLTFVTLDLTVPLAMVGFTLCLLLNNLNVFIRYTGLLVFLLIVLLSGYRSQLLLVALVIGVYFLGLQVHRKLQFAAVGVVFGFALLVGGYLTPVFESIETRFSSVADEVESVRSRELRFALKNFVESPVVGKGLSFPVPVAITRGDDAWDNYESSTVRYIHSFPGYVLMDTGLLGVIAFGGFWLVGMANGWRMKRYGGRFHAAYWTLVTLIGFFLVSAAFRQIQTTVVAMTLLHICYSRDDLSPSGAPV